MDKGGKSRHKVIVVEECELGLEEVMAKLQGEI